MPMLAHPAPEKAADTSGVAEAPGTSALALVKLLGLMALSSGSARVSIALMDGPVAANHAALAGTRIRAVGGSGATCTQVQSGACAHGTFVAGILAASRGSRAPAICPGCTLLVRPIFHEAASNGRLPVAAPEDLAQAIVECVGAGARILNLSAAVGPSMRVERTLHEALDHAAERGALVVAAAGNQATLGSSAITRHPWVIPVVAYDHRGRPMNESNLGSSIGKRGLGAPGEAIESLGAEGVPRSGGGTSAAAAFVTGAIALLRSVFPNVGASELKRVVTLGRRRRAVTPPLLNAESALAILARRVRVIDSQQS
jgi:subtilisin family serine protease